MVCPVSCFKQSLRYFGDDVVAMPNSRLSATFFRPCCGIDVSQNNLDVAYQNNLGEIFHIKIGNNIEVFKTMLEHTGNTYHFVMEATGVYYVRLAFFLHQQHCALSVVNALSINRYIKMQLERNKSDKKDAGWICRYAID